MHEQHRPGASNSGIIVDPDGLTIVDAQLTPSRGDQLRAAADTFDAPVRRLVLTSSHMPFVGGSGSFALPAVYGSAQISADLDLQPNIDGCCLLYPDESAGLTVLAERPCRPVTHTVTEAAWISPSLVVAPLSGEVDENLIVQVPEAQVVFAGAMCSFGVTPMAGLGNPLAWAESLDTLLEWGEIFVPGHGPIGGREEIVALQAYLRACVDAEGRLDSLADGPWRQWSGRHYDEVNVERAARLAADDATPPTSLLRLLGVNG